MTIEAIVRKDRKYSLLQRIKFDYIISQAAGKIIDCNELLDILSKFNSKFTHTQYTNSSAISSLSAQPFDEYGRNIYFSVEINDPQKLYRALSRTGFSLIDSKISRKP